MPRPRQPDTAATPAAYTYSSAAKRNAPTSETAARMTPEQVAEKPIPEPEYTTRVRIPYLVWNRQEFADHARTYGPLYVHDKVSPAQFVNTLLKDNPQSDLFAEFNGFQKPDGAPADDAGWYPYEYSGHWTNRLIRATGQRAMASLLYKDNLRGQVDLIYMDPPYAIDFKSNFQAAADSPETGSTLDHIPNDPRVVKTFRDSYRDGVHSYLDGICEQLTLGRDLLAETGSCIIQIGPSNVHQVALLMGEVFGAENHIATIPYQTARMESKQIGQVSNWLVWYAKNSEAVKYRQLYLPREMTEWVNDPSVQLENAQTGQIRTPTREEKADARLIPKGWRVYQRWNCSSSHASYNGRSDRFYYHPAGQPCDSVGWSETDRQKARQEPHRDHVCRTDDCDQPLPENWAEHTCSDYCDQPVGNRLCPKGRKCGPNCHATAYPCPTDRHWSVSLRGLHSNAVRGRLHCGERGIGLKVYADERPGHELGPVWLDPGRVANKQYAVQTPSKVLERCLLMTTDPGDLVLDLTCGSGALPIQAETWGRRWVACDVSAVSITIARECIATNVYPYHLLQDSSAGAKAEHALAQELMPPAQRIPFMPRTGGEEAYGHDPAQGFVNERQMKVSAATLAYGPKPDGSDVIYHPDRTARDSRKQRVAAPFTVESDSPYRAIAPAAADEAEARAAIDIEQPLQSPGFVLRTSGDAVTERIISNLETSGIGQPVSDKSRNRYRVENMQPTEKPDVTHTGTLVTPDGTRHQAHFYIGAKDEIISSLKTNYAAQTTAETPSVNYLVMIGFGRDENALPMARKHPRITILQVDAHRDLQLPYLQEGKGDHAFTIISEPEVRLTRQGSDKVTLSVLGMNAFNPRTGIVEPPNTRQVMCIMTDTAYDGESFRVRLMNVKCVKRNQKTLGDLRKALERAAGQEPIDPAKWEAMQTTTTVPFALPEPGVKIAVKVIDNTGTEHMAVLDDPRDARWY